MTWARLRAFVAVADTGSVRAAAARLSVTESAVSASVAALAGELSVQLVERRGRGLVLSEAGLVYAEYARRVLGLLQEGAQAAASGRSGEHGRLRLGAVTTAGEYLLPGLLASFRARHPDVEVTLEVGVRDLVHELISTYQLDLVIGGRPPAGRGLVTAASRRNALVVVSAPDRPADLRSGPWLLREAGSGTRETTLALLESLDLRPPLLALGSHGAVVASAVLGLGLALVSADAVARQLASGELAVVAVKGTPLSRPWHAVTGVAPTATTRLFIEHLVDPAAAGDLAFRPGSVRPRG